MPTRGILRRLTASGLARNSGSMLVYQLGRVLVQGIYFILAASALGVSGFGTLSALLALAALAAPFGSLGSINLMIRGVVRNPQTAPRELATALVVTVLSGLAMVGLLALATPLIAPATTNASLVALVAAAELLGSRVVEVTGAVYQAKHRMMRTATLLLSLQIARLAGAAFLLALPGEVNLQTWVLVLVGSSAVVTMIVVAFTVHDIGLARPDLRGYARQWREGMLFAVSLSSQSVYNDIDKAMLGRLASVEAAGLYTAAYRVVDMTFTPVRAMLAAAYPRFFREGASGTTKALVFTRVLAKPAVLYSLATGLVLLLGADLLPVVLGSDYAGAVDALRWLAVIPLLKAAHYLAADTLTGTGHQGSRTIAQISIAVLNVLLNLVLIPAYGYHGAIAASLVCDGLLAVALWLVLLHIHRRNTRRAKQ